MEEEYGPQVLEQERDLQAASEEKQMDLPNAQSVSECTESSAASAVSPPPPNDPAVMQWLESHLYENHSVWPIVRTWTLDNPPPFQGKQHQGMVWPKLAAIEAVMAQVGWDHMDEIVRLASFGLNPLWALCTFAGTKRVEFRSQRFCSKVLNPQESVCVVHLFAL